MPLAILNPILVALSLATAQQKTNFLDLADFLQYSFAAEANLVADDAGDLDGDGDQDQALILEKSSGEGADTKRTLQLFVLLKNPDGSFSVSTSTSEQVVAHPDCCELSISDSTLSIKSYGGRYPEAEAATHRFHLERGNWQLVALDWSVMGSEGRGQDVSIDFLTGNQHTVDRFAEKTKRSNTRPKLGTYYLADYSFDVWFGR